MTKKNVGSEFSISERNAQIEVLVFLRVWEMSLQPRLRNCELLYDFLKPECCSNDIQIILGKAYINHGIEHALMEIYEVVQLMRRSGISYSYKEGETDSVGLIIAYRNKLVTHALENEISGNAEVFAKLIEKDNKRVYRDIEKAVVEIGNWSRQIIPPSASVKISPDYLFSFGDVAKLISAVPSFRFRP